MSGLARAKLTRSVYFLPLTMEIRERIARRIAQELKAM